MAMSVELTRLEPLTPHTVSQPNDYSQPSAEVRKPCTRKGFEQI
jgi:hypothetical protein